MNEEREAAGLLLRTDVYYTRSKDGLYMLTHEGSVAFQGASVHPILVRLAPYLNGQHTLAELTANLSGDRRETVRRLITALIARGAVRRVPVAAGPLQDGAERLTAHGGEVSFLGYFHHSGSQAFQTYRARRAVVIGEGRAAAAVAAAARRSGLTDVRVPDLPGEAAGDVPVAKGDLVLHVAFRRLARPPLLLERRCAAAHADLLQAAVLDGVLWWTAPGPRAGAGPGWTTVELRRAARPTRRARSAAGAAADEDGDEWDGPAGTVAAARLMHQVFRSSTGVERPEPGTVACFDPRTMDGRTHMVIRHPYDGPARPPSPPGTKAASAIDAESFARRAARCVDDDLGIFGTPSERDFAQIPLHVCEMTVSDPVGLLGPDAAPARVTGAGIDFGSARLATALSAFSTYASLMVDPRRTVGPDGRPLFPDGADPFRALSALRADGARRAYVPGRALSDGGSRLVRVSAAFPVLRPGHRPFTAPPEVASAYTRREAVTAGVLAAVTRLTLAAETSDPRTCFRLDPETVDLDPVGIRYLSILAALGEDVTVHQIDGPFPASTMYCEVGPSARGCASGLSPADALRDALGRAILSYQARLHGQPAYAPPDPWPPPRGDARSRPARPGTPMGDLDALVAALAAAGHVPVAVPLDHDPEVSAVMPNTVHVVIVDG